LIYYQQRYNKYRNVSKEYNGHFYDSKFEASYAKDLDLRVKAKDIKSWERQIKIELEIYGKHICNYFVDFKILHNDGTIEYVEVKGLELPLWRFKWKLFEAIWNEEQPEIKLTVVK